MEPVIVFDSIFFQIARSGIARVWKSLLEIWSQSPSNKNFVILDRLKSCPRFEGLVYEDLPAYDFVHTSNDSLLIEEVCRKYNAHIFISSYYTTPISIPSLMMVYDMIPEKFDFDLTLTGWREKNLAIRHASAFVSISESTKRDLIELYPEIPSSSIAVAHCGVDQKVFFKRSVQEISDFRKKYNIEGEYYLFVGDRSQTKGYKNSRLFFDSLEKLNTIDFSIVCIGGNPKLEEYIQPHASKTQIHLLVLEDNELSIAYSDAIALVYPSLYEGFGLPIVEAMACGCPVITTREGSIPEAAGSAAHYISGRDIDEMAKAIQYVRSSSVREELSLLGITHASDYTWEKMANTTYQAICKLSKHRSQCCQPHIVESWSKYRKISRELQ